MIPFELEKDGNKFKGNLCETVFDINDGRFMVFKQYLIQSVEGVDEPLFAEHFQKYKDCVSNGKHADAVVEMQNYYDKITFSGFKENPVSMCFALICIEEDEDQLSTDKNKLEDKLKRLRDAGLTGGQVYEAVANFIILSPVSFGDYLTEMVMTKLQSASSELSSAFTKGSSTPKTGKSKKGSGSKSETKNPDLQEPKEHGAKE